MKITIEKLKKIIKNYWLIALSAVLFILLLAAWIRWPHLMTTTEWYMPEPSPEATHSYEYWEKFGALFNAFTPLVSIMGFAAVLLSIFHQDCIAKQEMKRQEAQSNTRMYIDMILAFYKSHGELTDKLSAQHFIEVSNRQIERILADNNNEGDYYDKELTEMVDAWKISYCQLACIIKVTDGDPLYSDDEKMFFKKYLSSFIGIKDSTIFSTLAFSLGAHNFIAAMQGTDLPSDEAALIDEWVTYYGYYGDHSSADEELTKIAIKRFIYSIFPQDDQEESPE